MKKKKLVISRGFEDEFGDWDSLVFVPVVVVVVVFIIDVAVAVVVLLEEAYVDSSGFEDDFGMVICV